jgi:DNA replication protein DnaC
MGVGLLSEADKLEMCRRGARFQERVYEPPKEGGCPLCGGEGYRFYWFDGYEFAEECDGCFNQIKSDQSVKRAGIKTDMTFENFYTDKAYQKHIKEKAMQYVKDGYLSGQWFFIGGQVGCGKTHICTAIVNALARNGKMCRYMAWREEAVHLKAIVNEHEEYHYKLMELCNVPVLYIDDLFKTQGGTMPTQADVNLAFQVINHRYLDNTKITIVSCEYDSNQLLDIDEATASRVIEKSKAYKIDVTRSKDKNYRLRE